MVIQCEHLSDVLAEAAEGYRLLPTDARAHVDRCLRCQAELVQHRKVLRMLRSLRTEVLEPAPGLLSDILATLEESGERHALRLLLNGKRAAYLGGIAAAATAGAAGALVLNRRRVS